MKPSFPSLRSDLLISRQEMSGELYVVIKDPQTRRFFRLREVEYAVAHRLDGATPLETVAHDLQTALNVAVDTETVAQFVEHLRRTGLLEADGPPPIDRRPLRQRVASNPLYIRMKALDPDRLFDRLLPFVRFCFTPHFLVGSAIAILVALCITVASWNEFARDVRGLYRFDALLLAWVTLLSVTTAHEFAHGLTCKHFGGHVHEIGFLLIYFQPAFYCNISDAWLFPERAKRMWVTFAGGYLETVVWAFATLVWRVTDTDTWLNFLALIVMATSGIKLFFNLNPLIKLDGYYLLSDYLEIPNLRQKSISYVKESITKLWRSRVNVAQVSRRERRVFVTYGLLAAVYSYWLLGIVALHFGTFLVNRYQGLGFLLFTGLLVAVFQQPVGKVASRLRAAASSPPGLASLKRRPRLVLAAVVVPALFLVRAELNVSGEFTILPGHNADVRPQVAGIIEQIFVDEGTYVRAGDPIARLAGRDYRAELRQTDAEIDEKRARLKMLSAGATRQEVDLARAEVETARTRRKHLERQYDEARRLRGSRRFRAEAAVTAAETRLQYATKDVERLKALFDGGLVSRSQFEQSEEQIRLREKELEAAQAEVAIVVDDELSQLAGDLAVATTAVEEAEGKLKVVVAGNRPEAIEAMEAEVARLEARRGYVQEQLRLTAITSPAAGVIATPRLREKIGEQVAKGDLIGEVYEIEHVTPEISVSEKEIGDVKPGQEVILRARAHPETTFSGKVKAISPRGADSEGPERKVFRVMVEMPDAAGLLKPEMTGNAKILCGQRSIFHLFTRRLARYLRVEFWSWW
jgi:multidrug resistance efflux pump